MMTDYYIRLSFWLSNVDYCVSRRLDYFGIVLEGDLANLGIVLAGNLDLNSCLFYYWQTDQAGNNKENFKALSKPKE